MNKVHDKIDLTRLYERYVPLVTVGGRIQFVRTVYTLSLCAVLIILIWNNGFIRLSLQKQNELFLIEQSQYKKTPSSDGVRKSNDIKHTDESGNQNKTVKQNKIDEKSTHKQQLEDINDNSTEVQKTLVPDKTLKQAQNQSGKKDYGLVKKTIFMGGNTPQVAVTFDDGYGKKTVEKVLDVLKKDNIKTTFFIIGKVLNEYPEVWKRAINEGHQICNHTNLHEVLTNMPDDIVQAEIQGWETSAQKALGEDYVKRMKKEFPYLRLPGGGGAKNDRILSIAQKNGYTVVGWNLETFSSVINPLKKTHSVKDISNRIEQHIVTRCANGSIILLHFNQYDTGNIEGILQGIKNRGFDIQPLSQIIK